MKLPELELGPEAEAAEPVLEPQPHPRMRKAAKVAMVPLLPVIAIVAGPVWLWRRRSELQTANHELEKVRRRLKEEIQRARRAERHVTCRRCNYWCRQLAEPGLGPEPQL